MGNKNENCRSDFDWSNVNAELSRNIDFIKRIQDKRTLTEAQGNLLLNEIQRLKNENLLRQQQGASTPN
jgi:hypothetical protein